MLHRPLGTRLHSRAVEHIGRLELTWTNKDMRLLAHEDGGYEWVPPSDYRVAEVRLLHDARRSARRADERARDNLLIRGDALNGLRSLCELPEFAREYVGKVKLAYLDPPFNTQQAFLQYDDALEHSVWLTMMRTAWCRSVSCYRRTDRCGSTATTPSRPPPGPDGRGVRPGNFLATVIWEKTDSPRMDAAYFSERHDFLEVLRKSDAWTPNSLSMDPDEMALDQVDADGADDRMEPRRSPRSSKARASSKSLCGRSAHRPLKGARSGPRRARRTSRTPRSWSGSSSPSGCSRSAGTSRTSTSLTRCARSSPMCLTEQTLGRGLRLPWRVHRGPLADTLEVLAYDQYQALLKKATISTKRLSTTAGPGRPAGDAALQDSAADVATTSLADVEDRRSAPSATAFLLE